MTRSYKQLDILERQRIYFLRKQGFSLRKIAEDLSRSPSTISREVKRNSGGRGYRCAQAQRKARQRREALQASAAPGEEAQQPRVGVFGQGTYTGQGGHNGASTDS